MYPTVDVVLTVVERTSSGIDDGLLIIVGGTIADSKLGNAAGKASTGMTILDPC